MLACILGPIFGLLRAPAVAEQASWCRLVLDQSRELSWCVPAMAHAHAARERRGDAPRRGAQGDRQAGEPGDPGDRGDREGGRGSAHYLEDVRTAASQMRRPSEASSLSWRCAFHLLSEGWFSPAICPVSRAHQTHRHRDAVQQVLMSMPCRLQPCPCWPAPQALGGRVRSIF